MVVGQSLEVRQLVDKVAVPAKECLWASLEGEERQRQEAVLELLTTEANYLHRLLVLLQVFLEPSGLILSEADQGTLFQNLDELIECSRALLDAMLSQRDAARMTVQQISPAFISSAKRFVCLKVYCVGHGPANRRLQGLLGSNRRVAKFVREGLGRPECGGLDLESFLLEPVQRLARYPLLLRQILHFTPSTHADHRGVLEALQAAESLGHGVNEAVRAAEDVARIEAIKEAFGPATRSLSGLLGSSLDRLRHREPQQGDRVTRALGFDLAGSTRALGPRRLIREGQLLLQAPRKARLTAYLFNDLLLLALSRNRLGDAWELAEDPLTLEAATLTFPAQQECFQVTSGARVLTLCPVDDFHGWRDDLERTHRDACNPGGARPLRPLRQHYVGTMEVRICSGRLGAAPPDSSQRIVCFASLGFQREETGGRQGCRLDWDQALLLSLGSLDDELEVGLGTASSPFAPSVVLGRAHLRLDILEYYGGGRWTEPITLELAHGHPSRATGSVTLKILYKPFHS